MAEFTSDDLDDIVRYIQVNSKTFREHDCLFRLISEPQFQKEPVPAQFTDDVGRYVGHRFVIEMGQMTERAPR